MVQVQVREGTLEGEIVESVLHYKYCSFKGIPFAEPPVGPLRFKAPQPPKPWNGIRQAKQHGPECTQFDPFYHKGLVEGSEDCLYLNVYTKDIKPKQPLPVMVWIHGGGFFCGSGNSEVHGPDFLIDKDVILVTFNYRLEVLGFLCLDTEEVPGNAGMKDQVAALKWVKNNIHNFGGDPNNITIFGESAGGASVSFHLVSPMSKGLFNRAIVQSGSHFCFWANSLCPVDVAFATAKELGKETNDIKELYNFFMNAPNTSLVSIKAKIASFENTRPWISLKYNIVNEKDFGQERFYFGNKYEIHDDIEIITGCTLDECISFTAQAMLENKLVEKCNLYNDIFVPEIMNWHVAPVKQMEISKKLKDFYIGNRKVTGKDIISLSEFSSMDVFNFGVLQLAKLGASKNIKTYLYQFSCVSNMNESVKDLKNMGIEVEKPVCVHGDDINYMFTNANDNYTNIDKQVWVMIQNTVKLFTNFAKTGNLTPDQSLETIWKPFCLDQQKCLDINEKLTMTNVLAERKYQFWESIFEEYLPEELAFFNNRNK